MVSSSKNKDQSCNFLTLNSKRAPLQIVSLFQLLPETVTGQPYPEVKTGQKLLG